MRIVGTIIGALVLATCAVAAEPSSQPSFDSPEAAVRALAAAARTGDPAKVAVVLGPGSDDVVSSGDPVADEAARKRFINAVAQRTVIEPVDDTHRVAVLGREEWPFPIPLVKDGARWRFDTAAGRDEIINRRVGQNELNAIAVARAYVQAQREYAAGDHGSGAGVFAQKVHSTAGQHDGLYWEDAGDRTRSPLGPLVAEADAAGYTAAKPGDDPKPFHGYLFRILTGQGANAPGGAKSYLVDGKMTGGFALVAWPAEYGVSGVQTFVVNQQGIVFEKDLGATTTEQGRAMAAYDPDASWTPVR